MVSQCVEGDMSNVLTAQVSTYLQESPPVPASMPPPPSAPAAVPAVDPAQTPLAQASKADQQPAAPLMPKKAGEPALQQPRQPSEEASSLVSVWHGQLAKSGVVKCKVEVVTKRTDQKPSWPHILDVRNRVAVGRALEHPKHILYVTASNADTDANNRRNLHDFCKYLTEKQRAGVATVGTLSDQQRELYLVPGCAAVFKQLHVRGPQQECLVAIPKQSE